MTQHTSALHDNTADMMCAGKLILVTFLFVIAAMFILNYRCPSNAMHSSIGQNISGRIKSKMAAGGHFEKNSDDHISATRHPIYFVFGSRLGFLATIALFNLTAHELHELYYSL